MPKAIRRSLYVLLPMLVVVTCTAHLRSWAWRALPSNIRVDAVLAFAANTGAMSACQIAIYKLSKNTADAIQRHGLDYLEDGSRPPGEWKRNRYGSWQETPGEIGLARNGHGAKTTFYALYAMSGCGYTSGQHYHLQNLNKALQHPGSYYRASANREGIIIVAPRQRLAAYFYFG